VTSATAIIRAAAEPAVIHTRRRRSYRRMAVSVAGVVVVVAAWQLLGAWGVMDQQFTSSPTQVAKVGWRLAATRELWDNVGATVQEYVVGMAGGALVGIPLGVLMGWWRRLGQLLEPTMTTLYVMPGLALLPILVLIFGIGKQSKIAMVFLETVLVLAITATAAIRECDPRLTRAAKSFSAGQIRMLRSVILPSALPSLLVGLRLAAGRGAHVVIVAELYAGYVGLGQLVSAYGNSFQMPELIFLVILTALFGYAVTSALQFASTKMMEKRGVI
jgi:NitT/TauT family transport system permease protein